MKIEDIQKMMAKLDNEQKVLIIKKEFYEEFKNEIDSLIKDNWFLDLVITNTLDDKTNAVLMNKANFYGIDL
jgi:hypothetical protein